METRPSALVAIAALSRLGAVAVLMPPDADLPTAARLGAVSEIITDPSNLEAARELSMRVLVLGGGEVARPALCPTTPTSSTWRRSTPTWSICPAGTGPTPGWPATSRSSRSAPSAANWSPARSRTTAGRCPRSAPPRRPTSARGDTVYCLTPLHHQSGLLVSLGGAVVGGSRIALSRGLRPDRFVQEIRQYGVTVVSYTWAMLREVIDDPSFVLTGNHPVRLFIGSGMPTGLWKRVIDVFAPGACRRVLRHHRRSGGAGQRVGRQGRQQGPAAARRRPGRARGLRRRRRPDPRGRPRLRAHGRHRTRSACCWPIRAGPIDPHGVGQTRRVRPGRHLGVHRVPVPARPATATTGWSTTAAR